MQYKGYGISTKISGDEWVAEIRRMDRSDLKIKGTSSPSFTTHKAATSDDAVKLAAQVIDSEMVGPVDIA
jgi:hypothetical protein